MNFIGGVRFVSPHFCACFSWTPWHRSFFFVGLLAGGPAAIWYFSLIRFQNRSWCAILQVVLYHHNCLHDGHCRNLGRNLFSTSAERLHLYLGSWKCWTQVCEILWFRRCLVVLYRLDDLYSRKLPSTLCSGVAWPFITFFFQTTANYIVSQLALWEIDFPGGIDPGNIKWRAVIWAISEVLLLSAVGINYLPPRLYSRVFRLSALLMMLDFFLCLIWLPIGVSKTYGFRSAKDVFTQTCKYQSHVWSLSGL